MYVTFCMYTNCTYVVYSSALCIKYNHDTSPPPLSRSLQYTVYVIEFITSMNILTINVPVVYMAWDVMILMWTRSITRAIERVGH